jgi:hypothetical protein
MDTNKEATTPEPEKESRVTIRIGEIVEFMGGWFRIHSVNGKRNRVTLKAISKNEAKDDK